MRFLCEGAAKKAAFKCFLLLSAGIAGLLLLPKPSLADGAQETPDPETDHRFSILWISDTQTMAYYGHSKALNAMGQWIEDNREKENIRFVVQTGDAVDNGYSERQWKYYDELYDHFRGKIPYISVAGNHEIKKHGYDAYLARPDIRAIPRENSFERGKAVYATFQSGDTKILLVGAGYDAESESVDWINSVLEQHRDYTAILLFHEYLASGARYSRTGKMLFEQVVVPNPNVRMVLCGHWLGVSALFEPIDDDHDGTVDRTVAQMMYNYQDAEEDCGQLRLLTFDERDRTVRVMTYSPYTGRYYKDYFLGGSEVTLENAF